MVAVGRQLCGCCGIFFEQELLGQCIEAQRKGLSLLVAEVEQVGMEGAVVVLMAPTDVVEHDDPADALHLERLALAGTVLIATDILVLSEKLERLNQTVAH